MTALASLTRVWLVVDHTHCPSIAEIRTVKDLALTLLIGVFSPASLHLLSTKHLKQSFCYTLLLTTVRVEVEETLALRSRFISVTSSSLLSICTLRFSMSANSAFTACARMSTGAAGWQHHNISHIYTVVQKNAPTLADYNCDPVQSILIIFLASCLLTIIKVVWW